MGCGGRRRWLRCRRVRGRSGAARHRTRLERGPGWARCGGHAAPRTFDGRLSARFERTQDGIALIASLSSGNADLADPPAHDGTSSGMNFSASHLTTHQAPLLGVNIDHVATLRNARGGHYPDPVAAALLAVEAGADIVTFHLREDRRHIRDDDVTRLKAALHAPLNFEAAV